MQLTFATGNPGKFEEATAQLAPLGIELVQWDQGYPELQADSLETVARFGVQALTEHVDPPFFLEDAGLFVDALDGFPGVYSSHAFATLGYEGVLTLMADEADRGARFRAVIGYHDGEQVQCFQGVVEGRIAREPAGSHGFGFDPIFVPEGHKRTFAEMPTDEKTQLSHRARALEALRDHLRAQDH